MKKLDVSLAPCHTAKALIGSFQPEMIKKILPHFTEPANRVQEFPHLFAEHVSPVEVWVSAK
jgi:hypothetical protein